MKLRPGRVGLDALASFVAVADSRSFSLAAGRLGLPRSSVSRHVARLEADLGERLLHRSTRRVALSVAGAALFERARPLVTELREALADLPERAGEPAGELRVTAPNDFGNYVLAGLLPALARRHPALRLDLQLTNRVVDLVAEGVDLAIRVIVGQPPDAAVVVRRLVPIEVGVYAAATYLARRGTPRTVEDAGAHDWVLFRSARRREPLPRGRVVAFADDFQFIHNAVAAGAGLGRIPGFLAAADLEAGRLVRLLPGDSWAGGRFCLVYPKTRQLSRKVVALRDFLLETIGG